MSSRTADSGYRTARLIFTSRGPELVRSLPIRFTHTPTSASVFSCPGRDCLKEPCGKMNAPTPILMDVDQPAALPFPQSLPEFQRPFPDDAACADLCRALFRRLDAPNM